MIFRLEFYTMIVWLASYPRSGNTLARQMLKQVFCHESYSQYNDRKDIGSRPDVASNVGHRSYEKPWLEFLAAAKAAPDLHIIKTHHPPQDDEPAIYVVRDGRAAAVSFFHFLCDERKREGVTLEKVIEGDTPFGSWGDHLDAWQPLDRPRTLFLRFEDMTELPEKVIASMALFLKTEKQMEWANNIASLQKLYPGFFRSGNDALNKAEMDARHNALFESRYGLWLRRLGYLD